MKTLSGLRAQRKALANEVKELVENHPEGEAWTSEKEEQYQNKLQAIEGIDAELDRMQNVIDISGVENMGSEEIRETYQAGDRNDPKEPIRSAVANFLRGGMSALTPEEIEVVRNRVNSPSNALSTGTGSEGGFLTDEEHARTLTVAMAAYGGMREAAQVIQTATGSQMDWPTTDPTSEEGEIVGENLAVTEQDTVFGTLPLLTYKYSSKSIAVPFELLQDSLIDIEAYVNDLLAMRLGRIQNRHFTVGNGAGQPPGIITRATVGKVGGSGQTTTFIYDDLVDLEHSVDPLYRTGANPARWMMHDNTIRDAKKIKDADGRPLWMPSLIQGDGATLMGYEVTANQQMAVQAANAESIAFGDFSKYVIRDVMQLLMFRMTDSKYTEKGQVGFLGFLRSGGQFVDVGGAVKTYQNAAT